MLGLKLALHSSLAVLYSLLPKAPWSLYRFLVDHLYSESVPPSSFEVQVAQGFHQYEWAVWISPRSGCPGRGFWGNLRTSLCQLPCNGHPRCTPIRPSHCVPSNRGSAISHAVHIEPTPPMSLKTSMPQTASLARTPDLLQSDPTWEQWCVLHRGATQSLCWAGFSLFPSWSISASTSARRSQAWVFADLPRGMDPRLYRPTCLAHCSNGEHFSVSDICCARSIETAPPWKVNSVNSFQVPLLASGCAPHLDERLHHLRTASPQEASPTLASPE
mmetsp:Transcript_66628/g.146043  ORF Transcript_66628/g.146043 Transcript_66628/m.146043 type:complete len:274 (-) Transcript_66628:463-1284(-)